MEHKNILIKEYVRQMYECLKDSGTYISLDFLNDLRDKYLNSDKSFEEIREQIDFAVSNKLNNPFYDEKKEDEVVEQKQVDRSNYYVEISPDFSELNKKIISSAKEKGFKKIGLVVDAPVNAYEYPDTNNSFYIGELSNFVSYIKNIKEENLDLEIYLGLSAIYDSYNERFLGDLRKKCDYMILSGVKCEGKRSIDYPLRYADKVVDAMSSGIFDAVYNPDSFINSVDYFTDENDRKMYLDNCIEASKKICSLAFDLEIPFIIDKSSDYKPNKLFYDIASSSGVSILCSDTSVFENDIDISRLDILPISYDPVNARLNNRKIQGIFEERQSKALTYETKIISDIVDKVAVDLNNSEVEDKSKFIDFMLDKYSNKFRDESNNRDAKLIAYVEQISINSKLSNQEKASYLSKLKKMSGYNNSVLTNRLSLVNESKEFINESIELGCQTAEEIKDVVIDLSEYKHSDDETKKEKIDEHLNQLRESINVSKDNQKNNNTGVKGFINSFVVALLTTFGIGTLVGIGIMIYVLFAV